MKHLYLFIFFALSTASYGFDQTHAELTEVLKGYVNDEGMVDYEGLLKNREGLDAYLKTTGEVPEKDFASWDKKTQLAFLINVYNAETLQFIIDNPKVASIKKIGSLFSSP